MTTSIQGTAAANCECPLSYGLRSYSSPNLLQKPVLTKGQFFARPMLALGGRDVC